MYGGSYGGSGGLYGGGMYGNNMYTGGYGGLYAGSSGMYGAGSSGMYGGGMYNSGMGGPMGGYGMGMGGPSSPPGFWVSLLRVMQGVVNFFGRIATLIDQNTQALHFFMTALLQLFYRSGHLYGELARFVLRILGVRTKPKTRPPQGPNGLPFPGTSSAPENQNFIEGPNAAPSGSWENVWGNGISK